MRRIFLLVLLVFCVGLFAGTWRINAKAAATPADDDVFLLEDQNDTWASKKVTATNLAAYIGQEIADDSIEFTAVTIDNDAGTNSITNIGNADIKAAAAIDWSKMANLGTGNLVLISDASQDVSESVVTSTELLIIDPTQTEAVYDAGSSVGFKAAGASQWTITAAGIIPVSDDLEDLGSPTKEIQDAWIDGVLYVDNINGDITEAELDILDSSSDESVYVNGGEVYIRTTGANQVKVTDGTIEPITDDDIDLGTSAHEFKDGYFDGTVYADGLTVDGAVDIDGGSVTINGDSGDYNFTVETDASVNAFYVDGGVDMTMIGSAFGFANLTNFADVDETPSVSGEVVFQSGEAAETITSFDWGGAVSFYPIIIVISRAAITYDVTGTNLYGGDTDIVTAAGDVTVWMYCEECDTAGWYLLSFIDQSDDQN